MQELITDYDPKDKVLCVIDYTQSLPKQDIVVITNLGNVKRISLQEFDIKKQSLAMLKLKENEFIVNISKYEKGKTMLFISKLGMALNADISDVEATSRTSGLVKGMSLNEGDVVIGGGLVDEKDVVAIITDKAFAKKVSVSEFGVLPRNRKGVKVITFSKDNGNAIVMAEIVKETFEFMVIGNKDSIYSISTDNISCENRTTKGKVIDKLAKNIDVKNCYIYKWN